MDRKKEKTPPPPPVVVGSPFSTGDTPEREGGSPKASTSSGGKDKKRKKIKVGGTQLTIPQSYEVNNSREIHERRIMFIFILCSMLFCRKLNGKRPILKGMPLTTYFSNATAINEKG